MDGCLKSNEGSQQDAQAHDERALCVKSIAHPKYQIVGRSGAEKGFVYSVLRASPDTHFSLRNINTKISGFAVRNHSKPVVYSHSVV